MFYYEYTFHVISCLKNVYKYNINFNKIYNFQKVQKFKQIYKKINLWDDIYNNLIFFLSIEYSQDLHF